MNIWGGGGAEEALSKLILLTWARPYQGLQTHGDCQSLPPPQAQRAGKSFSVGAVQMLTNDWPVSTKPATAASPGVAAMEAAAYRLPTTRQPSASAVHNKHAELQGLGWVVLLHCSEPSPPKPSFSGHVSVFVPGLSRQVKSLKFTNWGAYLNFRGGRQER